MTVNFTIMRNLAFTLAIFILIASCKKEKVDFAPVTITGSVFDSTNRDGMANIPIKIYWVGLSNQETSIGSTITNAQGNYSFQTKIEISRFKDQIMNVVAVVPNGFISIYDLEHTEVGASTVGYAEKLWMPRFYMYQKSNLSINLQRNSNDNFSGFQFYYNYGGRDYWVYYGNNPTGSTTYNVNTATGLSTRVRWVKTFPSGATTTFQDSIICLPNASNSITIPY